MANQQIHICRLPAVYSNSFPGVSQKKNRDRGEAKSLGIVKRN